MGLNKISKTNKTQPEIQQLLLPLYTHKGKDKIISNDIAYTSYYHLSYPFIQLSDIVYYHLYVCQANFRLYTLGFVKFMSRSTFNAGGILYETSKNCTVT